MSERFHLPSGALAELAGDAPVLEAKGLFASDFGATRARLWSAAGAVTTLAELPLADANSLRVLLRRRGLAADRVVPLRCRNCYAALRVAPCSTFEIGPYRDDELDDPDLDAPFRFDEPIDIERAAGPEPARVRLRLEALRFGQLEPLHERVLARSAWSFDAEIVGALGIAELDGETAPEAIAGRLNDMDDELLDAIVGVWEDAHYPPRLEAPHACAECEAVTWMPLPPERELSEPLDDLAPVIDPPPGMLDFDEFEQVLREVAASTYAELRVRAVSLEVVDGPAECDDGGEPLLGCYRPPDPEALPPHGPEVRVFYRTFAAMWRDDGAYDVREEARVTVEHELEHHLAFLAGVDPVDDDERAAIGEEHARRVGRREVTRRAAREVRREATGFFARTWYVWVLAALATALTLLAER